MQSAHEPAMNPISNTLFGILLPKNIHPYMKISNLNMRVPITGSDQKQNPERSADAFGISCGQEEASSREYRRSA